MHHDLAVRKNGVGILNEGQEARAVDLVSESGAAYFGQGRKQIDAARNAMDFGTGSRVAGPAQEERNPRAAVPGLILGAAQAHVVEGAVLVLKSVLETVAGWNGSTHGVAIVGGVDEKGVFEQFFPLQEGEEPADVLVHVGNHSIVIGAVENDFGSPGRG